MSATKKARKPAVDESSTKPTGKLKAKDYERELARLHVGLVVCWALTDRPQLVQLRADAG